MKLEPTPIKFCIRWTGFIQRVLNGLRLCVCGWHIMTQNWPTIVRKNVYPVAQVKWNIMDYGMKIRLHDIYIYICRWEQQWTLHNKPLLRTVFSLVRFGVCKIYRLLEKKNVYTVHPASIVYAGLCDTYVICDMWYIHIEPYYTYVWSQE